jgi:hypothetical protein
MSTRDKVFEVVMNYWREHVVPPGIRYVAKVLGIGSTATIFFHYQHLVKDGRIVMRDRRPVPVEIERLIKESYR